MLSYRTSRYPSHLARLVATRLRERHLEPPADKVLLHLLETLYFASLKTDEQRPCLCTVNYVDPQTERAASATDDQDAGRIAYRFRQPIPMSVRTLKKLAEAADPAVSSLAVYHDENGEVMIWGMIDQPAQFGEALSLDAPNGTQRPGLFRAAITGVGHLCVYKDGTLLGSLEQDCLIAAYHDVLWHGPVHKRLESNLQATLTDEHAPARRATRLTDFRQVKDELFVRWQNAICRLLLSIRKYGHGGGLLIVPHCPAEQLHVKYQLRYDRLPTALFDLARHQILQRQTADNISQMCHSSQDVLPCDMHYEAVEFQKKLEEQKNQALGCVRFIASLSRVDGFVLLDKSLVVHGFGVEARSDCDLATVYAAADARATPRLLSQASLSQFGTRHRAMMRYCYEHLDALGFVISQDGEIGATMRIKDRLIWWENINVGIGLRHEDHLPSLANIDSVTDIFQAWNESLERLRAG